MWKETKGWREKRYLFYFQNSGGLLVFMLVKISSNYGLSFSSRYISAILYSAMIVEIIVHDRMVICKRELYGKKNGWLESWLATMILN